MATGKSGWFWISTSSNNGIDGWISWSETYDANANTSNVTATLYYDKESTGYATWSDSFYFYITINGSTNDAYVAHTFPAGGESNWAAISHTVTGIPHNSDGSKSITISGGGGDSGTSGLNSSSGSSSVALTNIPRAATISSAANKTLGNYCDIRWAPKLSSHKFKLKFSVGSTTIYTTDYISPGTTSTYSYTGYLLATATFAPYFPSATSGTVTATLYTYNSSGTQIGSSSSKNFTVTLPNTSKPTIGSITNYGIDLINSHYITGKSSVRFTGTASGVNGSTISKYEISGGPYNVTVYAQQDGSLNYTGEIVSVSGLCTFNFVAIDSRGARSNVVSKNIMFYEYNNPSIDSIEVFRKTDNPIKISLRCSWSLFATAAGNQLASGYPKIKYKRHNVTESYTTTSDRPTSGQEITLTPTFAENISYDILIEIKDTFGQTTSYQTTVSTISTLMDFLAGGLSVAFGKMAETPNAVEFALDALFNKTPKVLWPQGSSQAVWKSFIDIIYPVGCIYTSVNSTDPHDLFGGTWERFGKGKVLVGVDENDNSFKQPNLTGGEKNHTLTVNEMPSHNHDWSGYLANRGVSSGSYLFPIAGSDTLSGHITNTGGGQSHNNMQPYVTVYMWKRTAW